MVSRQIHPLVRFAVERKVTMGMIVLGVVVLGWLSLSRLPLEFLPSFSSSNISVNAPYPSSSPEEIERLIVRPLEDSLSTINGIDTLSASAAADQARVNVSFVEGTDMDMAAVEVRDRIDRVRHLLPDDLERLSIRRFQSGDIPILRFDLSAKWDKVRLYDFVENVVQRRLERLEGVAQVSVDGLRIPELQVNLDPARMQAHGVDVRSLVETLRSANVNFSAGEIREGSKAFLVRAVGEFSSPDEIRRLPINASGLRLENVAEILYTFPEQEDFNFLNGTEALTVAINKTSTANLLAVTDRVKSEIAEIVALPEAEGLAFRIFQDGSADVRKGLGQLRDAGLIGGALAILAVFLFLRRFRTTLLVAIAIPLSVVATFVLLYFLRQAGTLDITLNVVSLAGLMLALGMLVDNSIVVIESIFRYRNELGESSIDAALKGTSEVALPILASTATTMCVFLPMIFLGSGGRFKLYMQNIGVTVCIVMVASLIVALTVVPMAAALILRKQEARTSPFSSRLTGLYASVLRFTLKHRLAFVISIVLLFVGVIQLFKTIERSFSSRPLERQVILKVDTPRQYSFEQIETLYADVYQLLDGRREELDISDIAYSYDRGTGRSRASWRRNRQFDIYLKDEEESTLATAEVRNRIRDLLPTAAGVELRLASSSGRYGASGVEIQLMGDDPVVLELLSRQLAGRLEQLPMIKDVDTSLESGDEEIHVMVERARALQAGVSTRAVAFTVSNALSSRAISHFKTGDREVDLIMQYREEDRETLDQLKNVAVFAAGGVPVPLGALADFEQVAGPQSIERENHLARVTVSANVADPSASFGAMGAVTGMLASTPLPPGYEWSFGRWTRWQQQDQESGLFALLFALPLVYMLLAALFESFAQPLTIMFSVPFALLGVGVVMKLTSTPWETMTMIGLIILLGIVVNNAIVLIDHINHLRQTGLDRDQAIITGGQHRMRPILITAITTILGMLPMVAPFIFPQWFGPLEGRAATWAPIGLVIIGGLTTSTFLTLLIIPTVYSLIDDLTTFGKRVTRAVQAPALLICALGALALSGCGDDGAQAGNGRPGGAPGGRPGGFPGGPDQSAAVPVEAAPVVVRDISSYIETNGTLEAENEVDIIARVSAPIVQLEAEEGMAVRKGQLLARLDEDELRARVEISRVALKEARLAFERAQQLRDQQLISTEGYEQALNRFETAEAQLQGDEIQIGYTQIRAPFDGLIVARYVDFAQQMSVNTPLFRISDFDPLLCPIRVPERELPLVRPGQDAYVQVEAYGDERFEARVLRISPVVDAATGTIKVTLEVRAGGRLRPGMFARAYLKTASKPAALVIPRAALSLESIGDTVYVAAEGRAERREVSLGFQEGDSVEILEGLAEGEQVVVVGQDGLSDGTPIQVL